MSRVLNVILSHQSKPELQQLLDWWSLYAPRENILLAYGGSKEEFDRLKGVSRVFISDPHLRANKTREKQSYLGVWQAATHWLQEKANESFSHVYFAEFDHLPLVLDLADKLLGRLEEEETDVLGHGVCRIDETSNVHYLYHLSDPEFMKFWHRISIRPEKEVVLRMLGTGSFWTRQAFMDVGRQRDIVSAYLEIYLPTLAHHLGYRVRDFQDQNRCVSPMPLDGWNVESARQAGCWTMHPIKKIPFLPPAAGRAHLFQFLTGNRRLSDNAC